MHGDGPDHPGWGPGAFPWLMPLPPTSQTLRKAMDNQAHSTGSLAGLALKLTEGTRGVWMGRWHKPEGWRTRVKWSLQPQFQKPTQDPFPSLLMASLPEPHTWGSVKETERPKPEQLSTKIARESLDPWPPPAPSSSFFLAPFLLLSRSLG